MDARSAYYEPPPDYSDTEDNDHRFNSLYFNPVNVHYVRTYNGPRRRVRAGLFDDCTCSPGQASSLFVQPNVVQRNNSTHSHHMPFSHQTNHLHHLHHHHQMQQQQQHQPNRYANWTVRQKPPSTDSKRIPIAVLSLLKTNQTNTGLNSAKSSNPIEQPLLSDRVVRCGKEIASTKQNEHKDNIVKKPANLFYSLRNRMKRTPATIPQAFQASNKQQTPPTRPLPSTPTEPTPPTPPPLPTIALPGQSPLVVTTTNNTNNVASNGTGNGLKVTVKCEQERDDKLRPPINSSPTQSALKPKSRANSVKSVRFSADVNKTAAIQSLEFNSHGNGSESKLDKLPEEPEAEEDENSSLLRSPDRQLNRIIIDVPGQNLYETINNGTDNANEHIYDDIYTEIDEDTALGVALNVESNKSIFEGATKQDILEYLEDAKERVEILINNDPVTQGNNNGERAVTTIDSIEKLPTLPEDAVTTGADDVPSIAGSTTSSASHRRNRTSNVSNSSSDSAMTYASLFDIDEERSKLGLSTSLIQLVERNDSGVGAETNKPAKLRRSQSAIVGEAERQCSDCNVNVEPLEEDETGLLFYPVTCDTCAKKRSERKEIIAEFVDTEFKYGRDLRIIREEFLRPMQVAGLLSKEQLNRIFINIDELIRVNGKFASRLQDAIDIANEQGDEDFTTVNIGKIFIDESAMLHAFETYCIRQGPASLLLTQLEKEKELLRIFLRVSQMENTLLRRMNLSAFLMVPVQRVTKWPLLLNRLYKVTPYHHADRDALKESLLKLELHLEHINEQTNEQTKSTSTKIWRRISHLSTYRRMLPNLDDIGNIKLRKAALEALNWNREEVQFVLSGKLSFTPLTDYNATFKKSRTVKFLNASALLVLNGKPNDNYRPDLVTSVTDGHLEMPRGEIGIKDAALLLMKEKGKGFVLCREPFFLQNCIVSSDGEQDIFEISERMAKESYHFKSETYQDTRAWFGQLCYVARDLGWKNRRRNALANIMMVKQD